MSQKNRNAATAGAKDVDHFAKELVTRVQGLAHLVLRVPTVFGDEEHSVDGQSIAPPSQGIRDRRVHVQAPIACNALAAEVGFGKLIDVERNDVHLRTAPAALPAVPLQKPVDDVLAMRVLTVLAHQGGDLRRFVGCAAKAPAAFPARPATTVAAPPAIARRREIFVPDGADSTDASVMAIAHGGNRHALDPRCQSVGKEGSLQVPKRRVLIILSRMPGAWVKERRPSLPRCRGRIGSPRLPSCG